MYCDSPLFQHPKVPKNLLNWTKSLAVQQKVVRRFIAPKIHALPATIRSVWLVIMQNDIIITSVFVPTMQSHEAPYSASPVRRDEWISNHWLSWEGGYPDFYIFGVVVWGCWFFSNGSYVMLEVNSARSAWQWGRTAQGALVWALATGFLCVREPL